MTNCPTILFAAFTAFQSLNVHYDVRTYDEVTFDIYRQDILYSAKILRDGTIVPIYIYNSIPTYTTGICPIVLNPKETIHAYELRGKMLLKGTLDKNCNFEYDKDSGAKQLHEYNPIHDLPIWNLPGRLIIKSVDIKKKSANSHR